MSIATRSRSPSAHCCKIDKSCIRHARCTSPSLLRPHRLWWNILDKALYCYGKVLTRADRHCYVPYSIKSRKKIWNQIKYTHYHDAVFEKNFIQMQEVQLQKNPWQESLLFLRKIFPEQVVGPSIEVSLQRTIEELEEIPAEQNTKMFITLLQCLQSTGAFWDR